MRVMETDAVFGVDLVSVENRPEPLLDSIARGSERSRGPATFMLCLFVLELIWGRRVGVSIASLTIVVGQAVGCIAAGALWQAAASQAAGAGWRSSRVIEATGDFVSSFGLQAVFACVLATFSYLCARATLPLWDAQFAAADAALGFDWLAWRAMIDAHPMVRWVLHAAYASVPWQIIGVCALMPFSGDRWRVNEFVWLAIVTCIIACLISMVMPAIGARPWFGIPGASWMKDLTLLRSGAPATFDISNLKGIVTFPSYHAALCVLFSWAARRTGPIGIAAIVLNLVMLASTASEGGHYLVDIIAGLLLATTAIAVSQRFRRFTPAAALG